MNWGQKDIGKRVFVDGNRAIEGLLIGVEDSETGQQARVLFDERKVQTYPSNRIQEIVEVPTTPLDVTLSYPLKPTKLVIEVLDEQTGETVTRWLEGNEAAKWNAWMRELCYKAETLGLNPKWMSLRWNIKREKKNANV